MAKEYPTPKKFEPSLEDQKRVADQLAGLFSSNVAIGLSDGSNVQGHRDQLKVSPKNKN